MAFTGCDRPEQKPAPKPAPAPQSLSSTREGFQTQLARKERDDTPPSEPPTDELRLIQYDTPIGPMAAYLSANPEEGSRHPAIVWIFGGFGNSIDSAAWEPGPPEDDQSAMVFREAGVVTMYPSMRGANGNPGVNECMFGEVDDVLAAAEFLASVDYVDPARIYLGGHSTGGTLSLLVAECGGRFRAVFSFGPVASVGSYGQDNLPFSAIDVREISMRSPVLWLDSIKSPAFVFEGMDEPSNIDSVATMEKACRNPRVGFYGVAGADHFSILAPASRVVAERILQDVGPKVSMDFSEADIAGLRKL